MPQVPHEKQMLTVLSLCITVSSQKWQPGQQPSVSGPHRWHVSPIIILYDSLNFLWHHIDKRGHSSKIIFQIQCGKMQLYRKKCKGAVPYKALMSFHYSFLLVFSLQKEKWMNVRVGDIIKLENNQFVAVSLLWCFMTSLSPSDPNMKGLSLNMLNKKTSALRNCSQ